MRLLFALLLLALAPSHGALAHAILVESQPADGAVVAPGNLALHLRYNSRIDRARSRLTLTGPGQAPAVVPIAATNAPDRLEATATVTEGAWTLRWQVLAVDGHITRGDVHFTVQGAKGTAP